MENFQTKTLLRELTLRSEIKTNDTLPLAFSLAKAHFFDITTDARIRNN